LLITVEAIQLRGPDCYVFSLLATMCPSAGSGRTAFDYLKANQASAWGIAERGWGQGQGLSIFGT
jgi:hypothetical protein